MTKKIFEEEVKHFLDIVADFIYNDEREEAIRSLTSNDYLDFCKFDTFNKIVIDKEKIKKYLGILN